MWFKDRMEMLFAKAHNFKTQKLKSEERLLARLKPGSTADIMTSIEDRIAEYALSGDVEVSNNISEQSVRKLKMNLKNADNIGSESSAADNAFMYSVNESCKHNDIDPGKYISYLLGKLKTVSNGQDLTGLLPCYCGL